MHKAYVKTWDEGPSYELLIHQDVLEHIGTMRCGSTYIALLDEEVTRLWGGMEPDGYRSRISQDREEVMTAYRLVQALAS